MHPSANVEVCLSKDHVIEALRVLRVMADVMRLRQEGLKRVCILLLIDLSCRPPHPGFRHLAQYPFYRLKTLEVYGY